MKFLVFILFLLLPIVVNCQIAIGVVLSVQDGDSFHLLTPDSIYNVRLYGIDCPEINQHYGEKARDFLSKYMADTVTIMKKDIDKYRRTVAEVYYRDSLINLKLVEIGLAWHYKKYSSDSILALAETSARDHFIGIWSEKYQIAPWDWRSGNFDRTIVQNDSLSKVFICVGREQQNYHHVHYCPELKKCKSSIILTYPLEAIEVYKKTQCPKCIN